MIYKITNNKISITDLSEYSNTYLYDGYNRDLMHFGYYKGNNLIL